MALERVDGLDRHNVVIDETISSQLPRFFCKFRSSLLVADAELGQYNGGTTHRTLIRNRSSPRTGLERCLTIEDPSRTRRRVRAILHVPVVEEHPKLLAPAFDLLVGEVLFHFCQLLVIGEFDGRIDVVALGDPVW